MGIRAFKLGVRPSQDGVSLGLLGTAEKFGELDHIKATRSDLRQAFDLADSSDSRLQVWLERDQNKEAMAAIADDLIARGRFTMNGGIRTIQVPLSELLKAKDKFRLEPVVVGF
jgi:hypothetical protein